MEFQKRIVEKNVHIHYYAVLREESGQSEESVTTTADTPGELFEDLQGRYGFSLEPEQMRVVVNAEVRNWDTAIRDGDTVVFLPPVAGG